MTPVQRAALARILPNLSEVARAGAITSEQAVAVIHRAIASHFPAAVHVFAFGSCINGAARPYSDIDVIVTLTAAVAYERKCLIFDGYPVDVQVIGLPTITQTVAKARAARFPFLLHSVATATIVIDRDGRAAQLQNWVAKQYDAGPLNADARAIDLLRLAATELVMDLCTLDDRHELVATGMSLHHTLMNLLLPSETGWLQTGKHIPREIAKRGSSRFRAIADAHRDLLDGNADPLIALSLSVLDSWGGPLWDGATQSPVPRETSAASAVRAEEPPG